MNYEEVKLAAFCDELEKISALEKEAIFETLRVGAKALKQSLLGGKKLVHGGEGMFHAERQLAVSKGQELMSGMEEAGIKIHRARVKSPGSIAANAAKNPNTAHVVPDDLLGMQTYGHGPEHVQKVLDHLTSKGAKIHKISPQSRPGYHGVNIKGHHDGVNFELQVSPGRTSNMGQIMEHSLGYKPATEAPHSNFIDRWVGKHVAPRMVSAGSWVPGAADHINHMMPRPQQF